MAASHEYVGWAKERIDEGRAKAGRTDHHRITMFALYSVDSNGDAARSAVREPLAFYKSNGPNALTDIHGISEELADILSRGGYEALVREMPEAWLEDLTIAGTPEECAMKIRAAYDAGADTVALFPMPTERVDQLVRLTADEVLPFL